MRLPRAAFRSIALARRPRIRSGPLFSLYEGVCHALARSVSDPKAVNELRLIDPHIDTRACAPDRYRDLVPSVSIPSSRGSSFICHFASIRDAILTFDLDPQRRLRPVPAKHKRTECARCRTQGMDLRRDGSFHGRNGFGSVRRRNSLVNSGGSAAQKCFRLWRDVSTDRMKVTSFDEKWQRGDR
jgi:hypothetical protein